MWKDVGLHKDQFSKWVGCYILYSMFIFIYKAYFRIRKILNLEFKVYYYVHDPDGNQFRYLPNKIASLANPNRQKLDTFLGHFYPSM